MNDIPNMRIDVGKDGGEKFYSNSRMLRPNRMCSDRIPAV